MAGDRAQRGQLTVDNLDDYVGRLIDVDGVRYLLVGLDGQDALLSEPDPDPVSPERGALIHLPSDYVAEAMTQLLPRPAADRRR